MTVFSCERGKRRAWEAKGVGSMGLQVAVWGPLEGSSLLQPAVWAVDHPAPL